MDVQNHRKKCNFKFVPFQLEEWFVRGDVNIKSMEYFLGMIFVVVDAIACRKFLNPDQPCNHSTTPRLL